MDFEGRYSPGPAVCDVCSDNFKQENVWRCTTCCVNLCQSHFLYHNQSNVNGSHEFIAFTNLVVYPKVTDSCSKDRDQHPSSLLPEDASNPSMLEISVETQSRSPLSEATFLPNRAASVDSLDLLLDSVTSKFDMILSSVEEYKIELEKTLEQFENDKIWPIERMQQLIESQEMHLTSARNELEAFKLDQTSSEEFLEVEDDENRPTDFRSLPSLFEKRPKSV